MSAVLSPCGTYRYHLRREWLTGEGTACWIMLNPSTADAELDDPTIRRVVGFSQRWGFAAAEVVNLYAYRATDPKAMRAAERSGVDVVGPDNDDWIVEAAYDARLVIAGWGAHEPAGSARSMAVVELLADRAGQRAWSLGVSRSGQPRHPLMLGYDTEREPWEPA